MIQRPNCGCNTMLECAHCESAQELHITQSELTFDSDTKQLQRVAEALECTRCGSTGVHQTLSVSDHPVESISGDIRSTEARPRSLTAGRRARR